MIEIKSKRVRAVIDELKDQYLEADRNCRPWIIGFSGGKDSNNTLDAHVDFHALAQRGRQGFEAQGLCGMQ